MACPAQYRRKPRVAELDYVPFAPHNASSLLGTIAHVWAAGSNLAVLEWHAIGAPHWANFVRYLGGEIIQYGHIELTEAPGLGWDEDVALEHRHSKGGIQFFG
jgi:L-alanine-DL-glutamate epimerase-like enolase superfamily enzyme